MWAIAATVCSCGAKQPRGDGFEITRRDHGRMRRLGVMLALLPALTMALTTPARSEASADALAPTAEALREQYAAKSGVRFTSTMRVLEGGAPTRGTVSRGTYRFNASGVSASHISETEEKRDGWGDYFRMINIGKRSYTKSDMYALPRGKTWLYWPNGASFRWADDLIDPLSPRFLRLMSSDEVSTIETSESDGRAVTQLAGKVHIGCIGTKAAGIYWGPDDGFCVGGWVQWKLWLGSDDLPRHFNATISYDQITDPGGQLVASETFRVNTLYTKWGDRSRIVPPPSRLVATQKEYLTAISQ